MDTVWVPLPAGSFGADPRRPGADPLFTHADGTTFRDFLRDRSPAPIEVPVLCELQGEGAMAALAKELKQHGGRLPAAYRSVPARKGHFCTAVFSATYTQALARGAVGKMLRRFEMQLPVIPARPASQAPASKLSKGPAAARPQAGRLLLGVIDSGCAFAHASLRRPDGGTRLLALWDQDDCPGFVGVGGARPRDFGYGAEVHRPALDALMAASRRRGTLDEDDCYRRAGLGWLQHRLSHGTAVLDLFAGARTLGSRLWVEPDQPPSLAPAGDAASQADLVFVDLPRDSVQDSTSGGLGRWLLDGLRYICSCAGPTTERIVVNISNGTSRSTHDGQSLIEQAMAALVDEQALVAVAGEQALLRRQLRIVVAAGNDRDEERHAQFDALQAGQPVKLTLRVPPGSEAPNWVTVRVPPGARNLTLRLRAPGASEAQRSPPVGAGQTSALTTAGAAPTATIVFPQPAERGAGMALVVIAATERSGPGAIAAHGDWELQLESATAIDAPVHLYTSRNQRNPNALDRGRQARFVSDLAHYDPLRWRRAAEVDPVPALSPIRRAGTLNGLATLPPGLGVVVAGSAYQRPAVASPYSSAGPSAGPPGQPARPGPDLAAVTCRYHGLAGIVAAGARSGAPVRVLGTSYAAPQLARYIANFGVLPAMGVAPDRALTGAGVGFV